MRFGNDVLVAICALSPLATASLWPRGFSAASSAGAAVSAEFPPHVSETFNPIAVFPGADVVGFPGPTPSQYPPDLLHVYAYKNID